LLLGGRVRLLVGRQDDYPPSYTKPSPTSAGVFYAPAFSGYKAIQFPRRTLLGNRVNRPTADAPGFSRWHRGSREEALQKRRNPMRSRPLPVTVAAILQVLLNVLNFPGPWWLRSSTSLPKCIVSRGWDAAQVGSKAVMAGPFEYWGFSN
jgi:hypothetical protein